MKKGDIVTINDSSWSRSIVNGKLIHELLSFDTNIGKKYKVIETGCSFPNSGCRGLYCFPPTFNNTVIQAIDSGKVVFIEERFLRPVPLTHTIIIDAVLSPFHVIGKVVKISDELYKKIIQSLTSSIK